MKSIQEDIKTGNFKQSYLLFGEEAYLKHQYKEKLLNALNPDGDTMNFSRYEGKGVDVKQLIDLCETMPFFAERRIILLEDTGFFKNKCEELADYMKSLPDYLVLVFSESEVDKRSRMYKAVKSGGRVTEFAKQDEKTLMRWAAGILGKEGRKITQRDMELFLTKTGTDMGNIRMELEKLITYTEGQDIVSAEDIEAVCVTQTTNKIFDMVRAVTEKNQKRALELYYDLLTLKEPPMRILFLLAKQFRQLLLTKKMSGEGASQNEIATRLGVPSFVVRNISACARSYTVEELEMFGQIYANEQDYMIGDEGWDALYEKISALAAVKANDNEPVTIKDVIDMVAKAINHANGFFRKMKMGQKRYDENDYVILFAKDFGK